MKMLSRRALGLILVLAMVVSLLPTIAYAKTEPAVVTDPEVLAYAYWDTSLSDQERAADLISHMTLAEKAHQLASHPSDAIPRLGVAAYWYPGENLNGIANISLWYGNNVGDTQSAATSFPSTLSQGSTWNPELIGEMANAIGDEARVFYNTSNKGLSHWGPSVNLARDPRWGRTGDSFGEDVILSGAMGSWFVKGFQGALDDSSDYLKAIACIKHFAANNAEAVRSNGSSNMSEEELREFYLRHFEIMVEDADPACVMGAYNAINGIPCHGNYNLLTNILRLTWGFDGWVVSDNTGVENLHGRYGQNGRNVALNDREKFPVLDGNEADTWNGNVYLKVESPAGAAAAAIEAGVSLDLHTIRGNYYYANLVEAVENGLTNEETLDQALLEVLTTRFASGEFDFADDYTEGYQSEAAMIAKHEPLAEEVANESIVMLENNGILPVDLSQYESVTVVGQYIETLLYSDYKSNEAWRVANGVDINFAEGIKAAVEDYNKSSGKNPIEFVSIVLDDDASTGKIGLPDDGQGGQRWNHYFTSDKNLTIYIPATRIVMMGSGADAGEGRDRSSIVLPRGQAELENLGLDRAENLVVMMHTQSIVDVDFALEEGSSVDALLWASYLGEKQGKALANILTGKANPSGHLTTTWYSDESQLAELQHDYSIYDSDGEGTEDYGRTYMYFTGDYDYPFGYGLSYSTFEYSGFALDAEEVTGDSTVTATVTVTNTSEVDGADVLQIYAVGPKAQELNRPMRQLVAFQRVELAAGESKELSLSFDMSDLACWNSENARFEMDLGDYAISLRTDADSVAEAKLVVEDYTDVAADAWYYDAVMGVSAAGLMNGVGNNAFNPGANVSRGQIITVLYRLAGSPEVSTDAIPFNDVPSGMYYTDAIAWAAEKNIAQGRGDGRFSPDDDVTREQMVCFLYRFEQAMGNDVSATTELSFSDSGSVSDWAEEAMKWAVASDIIHGTDKNTVLPQGTATRAEFATMMYNYAKPDNMAPAEVIVACTADITPTLKNTTARVNNYILNKGETVDITVSASVASDKLYADPSQMPSTFSISFESSKANVATVDANGKVTAVAPGVCTITVTVTDSATNTSVTASHPVVVLKPAE